MTGLLRIAVVAFLFSLASCASHDETAQQKALEQVEAPKANAAITLNMVATPDLNTVNGLANSCTVLILQASTRSEFDDLIKDPERMKQLFLSAGGDKKQLSLDRYVMMPGQHSVLHIDRAERARYIAVLAGYYPEPGEEQTAILAVPVEVVKKGMWPWSNRWHASLSPLNASFTLGRSALSLSENHKPVEAQKS